MRLAVSLFLVALIEHNWQALLSQYSSIFCIHLVVLHEPLRTHTSLSIAWGVMHVREKYLSTIAPKENRRTRCQPRRTASLDSSEGCPCHEIRCKRTFDAGTEESAHITDARAQQSHTVGKPAAYPAPIASRGGSTAWPGNQRGAGTHRAS